VACARGVLIRGVFVATRGVYACSFFWCARGVFVACMCARACTMLVLVLVVYVRGVLVVCTRARAHGVCSWCDCGVRVIYLVCKRGVCVCAICLWLVCAICVWCDGGVIVMMVVCA